MKILSSHSHNTPLSTSPLWEWQKNCYQHLGIKAWSEEGVPFYLTNHPKLAEKYAQVILTYLLENQAYLDPQEPITILELGSGIGKLAYYLTKIILKWCSLQILKPFQMRIILSDICKKNINFWQNHPQWKSIYEKDLVDFALYDPIEMKKMTTIRNNEVFCKKNPLIVLGNYYFDSIPQDIYQKKNNKLHKGHFVIHTQKTIVQNPLLKKNWEYEILFKEDLDPPQDISEIANTIPDGGYLTYPIAGIQVIESLKKISNGNLLLLIGDKAQYNHTRMNWLKQPPITFHTTVSYTVNFEALKNYCQRTKGQAKLPTSGKNIFNNALLHWGTYFCSATSQIFEMVLDSWSLEDHYITIQSLEKQDLETLCEINQFLRFDCYDPYNFHLIYEKIVRSLKEATQMEKTELKMAINQAVDLFYPTKQAEVILLTNMAKILLLMNFQQEAMNLMDQASCLKV